MTMDFIKRNSKRVAIDGAGYLLIVAAILTGWLPGPGGIPLALAGLGLLSINNACARKIRDYLLHNGGKVVEFMFPKHQLVQWLYDIVVVLLLVFVGVLEWQHSALWQISLGVALFFVALFLALMNRDRLKRFRRREPAATAHRQA